VRGSLRILVVSDMPPLPVTGGGERALWETASGMARRGHRVTILARRGGASGENVPSRHDVSRFTHRGSGEDVPRRDDLTRITHGGDENGDGVQCRDGVTIRTYPADRRSSLRFARSAIQGARRVAADEIKENGCDVIHVHQPVAGYGVLRIPESAELPSLYTVHSPAPLEYRLRRGTTAMHRGGLRGLIGSRALRYVESACLARASRIHVLSEYSAGLVRQLYGIDPGRIVRIPGGVDLARFHPAADRREVRCGLDLPGDRPILLTVRNLEARMGLDLLLRTAALLVPRMPGLLLLIGGEGGLRPSLEKLASTLGLVDHVRFLGFIPEDDLAKYYQAADLFLLPTTDLEGFGLVTVEALACGTPVVGTRVGATPEILEPLDPSLLFEAPVPAMMAAQLGALLDRMADDPDAAASLRESCVRHAWRHYSWESSLDLLEACLVDLSRSARSARELVGMGGGSRD